jgi:hypothetical protein
LQHPASQQDRHETHSHGCAGCAVLNTSGRSLFRMTT